MWFNFWLSGFLAGFCGAQITSLSLVVVLFLCPGLICCYRKPYLWFVCGIIWGTIHNAPLPSHSVGKVKVVKTNPLHFFFAEVIVSTSESRYRARSYPHSSGMLKNRNPPPYFIFVRPPAVQTEIPPLPAPPLILQPRNYLLGKTEHLAEPVRSWIMSISLGNKSDLPRLWQDAFRFLGLFHILVISGLHITIIASCGRKLLNLIFRPLYIVRLINPLTWLYLTKTIALCSCVLIIGYGCLIGFSQPAQRAVLLFLVYQIHSLLDHRVTYSEKIKHVLFLQTFLFPIGFLTDSLLLSWGTYLVVVHCFQEIRNSPSITAKMRSLIKSQATITLLIVSFFGELSLLSIPLNLLLLPLIPFVIVSGFLLLLLSPQTLLFDWISRAHLLFLQQIETLADITSNYSWLTLQTGDSALLRGGIFLILLLLLLNKSAFLTKRKKRGSNITL